MVASGGSLLASCGWLLASRGLLLLFASSCEQQAASSKKLEARSEQRVKRLRRQVPSIALAACSSRPGSRRRWPYWLPLGRC